VAQILKQRFCSAVVEYLPQKWNDENGQNLASNLIPNVCYLRLAALVGGRHVHIAFKSSLGHSSPPFFPCKNWSSELFSYRSRLCMVFRARAHRVPRNAGTSDNRSLHLPERGNTRTPNRCISRCIFSLGSSIGLYPLSTAHSTYRSRWMPHSEPIPFVTPSSRGDAFQSTLPSGRISQPADLNSRIPEHILAFLCWI
jgi:hypothetical protein